MHDPHGVFDQIIKLQVKLTVPGRMGDSRIGGC
jgi:hypothetical protein